MMDERQRLIKLYEAELEKNRQIKKDMDSLGNMTDEQLFALVEKAQMFYQILEKGWEQIAGGDLRKKDVMPVLMNRAVLKNDFSQIQQIEDEVSILKADLQSSKEKWKQYHARNREERKKQYHRMLLVISFGLMFICSIVFHLIMLRIYNNIVIPAVFIMTLVPLFLFAYHAYALKQEMDVSSEEESEELEREIQALKQKIEEKESLLRFYDQKYQTVLEEVDEYQMEAYPYVEKIVHKLEYRENYRRAKNEYCGILEILHFQQPDQYLFCPEIFLIEKEMDGFLQQLQEKMRKLDGYLTQTLETA